MNKRKYAEEYLNVILKKKRMLVEIPYNYSQGETGVLVYLTHTCDGVSPSTLSCELNLSIPRILAIINSLETKKLIKKELDISDKRKSKVYITSKGKKLVASKEEEAINSLITIMEQLTCDEINDYIRITEKIGNIMNNIETRKGKIKC